MSPTAAPDRTEAAPYYFTYIDKVPQGDIRHLLETQLPEAVALLSDISEDRSRHRYAPGKWSIREVLHHLNDTERLFVFRALWFARGFNSALPSFDQDVAVAAGHADRRAWQDLLAEFKVVRAASLAFYRSLPDDAWARTGIASGNPFTVRALACCTVGHVAHHLKVLREKYL